MSVECCVHCLRCYPFLILFLFFFLSLPPQDYKRSTGDTIIRYACVTVSMMQTDTILDTEADVGSSLLGVKFYVYVNETIHVFISFFFFCIFFSFSLFLFFSFSLFLCFFLQSRISKNKKNGQIIGYSCGTLWKTSRRGNFESEKRRSSSKKRGEVFFASSSQHR